MGGSPVAEPILKRVQRVVAASLESAADAAERVSGTSMMRHAIRELDQTIGKIAGKRDVAEARRLLAERQQNAIRAGLKQLSEDARFAIGKGRDDLAEAVLARQIDHEAELDRLRLVGTEASEESARLDESIGALRSRKAQMEKELSAIEVVRQEIGASGANARIERKVKRAEDAFERTMATTGLGAGVQPSVEAAELDAIRKSTLVAERMAALKGAPKADRGKLRQPRAKKRVGRA